MDKLLAKLLSATGASLIVTESANLEPLWTALITLGVSIITVLSVEGVAWLKQFIKTKIAKAKAEEDKLSKVCEEADEQCEIAKAINKKED